MNDYSVISKLYIVNIKCELEVIKERVIEQEVCFYCKAPTYKLSDGRVKCSKCKKRYSPKKLSKELAVIEAFCSDMTALEASKELSVSYSSIRAKYHRYREALIPFLELEYEKYRDSIQNYDEFLYIDHNKRANPTRYIFDAHNFLTFDYGGRVYTIMMPPLDRFKSAFLEDGIDEVYYSNLYEFLNIHRISRLKSKENTIVKFWDFLDNHLKQYKGLPRDNFIYYLKEAEFKFNYPNINKRIAMLLDIIFS